MSLYHFFPLGIFTYCVFFDSFQCSSEKLHKKITLLMSYFSVLSQTHFHTAAQWFWIHGLLLQWVVPAQFKSSHMLSNCVVLSSEDDFVGCCKAIHQTFCGSPLLWIFSMKSRQNFMGCSFLYLSLRHQDFFFMINFRYVICIAEVTWL